MDNRQALDDAGIVRMCCRTAFVAYSNPTNDYMAYSNDDAVLDDIGTIMLRRVRNERSIPCYTSTATTLRNAEVAATPDTESVVESQCR